MSGQTFHGHAAKLVRDTLLAEVVRLKALLPDKENVRRNLATIERARPVEQMDHAALCTFVDLLNRSQP